MGSHGSRVVFLKFDVLLSYKEKKKHDDPNKGTSLDSLDQALDGDRDEEELVDS